MKKLLLSAFLVPCLFVSISAQKKTILSQNFETSKTAMPPGWSQQFPASAPTNLGWQFDNVVLPTTGYLANQFMKADGSYFTFVNDVDNNSAGQLNNDTLYSPIINCSPYFHAFLSFKVWYQGFYNPNNGNSEDASVIVSTDGGHTWTTALTKFYGSWTNLTFDISSYVGAKNNVKLGFTYTDDGEQHVGMGLDNILLYEPLNYDLSVTSQDVPFLLQVGTPYIFSGTIVNFGGDSIVSMNMNYSVNGGIAQVENFAGISGFNGYTAYNYGPLSTIPFTPSKPGSYTVKIWADHLNGTFVDENHSNDTLVATFFAVDTLQPRMPLFEEFSCASCNPCMAAMPNIDSVSYNNSSICNTIKYHWYYPGRDFMNDIADVGTICNDRLVTYYGFSGVPYAALDGKSFVPSPAVGPPPYISSAAIQQDAALGSPFAIDITNAGFNPVTKTFSLKANIKSFANLPAGITAQVALTIDTITYFKDQSQEDPTDDNQWDAPLYNPPTGFQPPDGNNPNGVSDYYWQFVTKFPEVIEHMFPSDQGTSLGSFTDGQTQTISVSWVKNHAWGDYNKGNNKALGDTTLYDSTKTAHFTVFLQSNAGIPALGIPQHYVFQSKSIQISEVTGMEEISSGIYFEMYPNPTNNITNVAFKLDNEQNVSIKVYNLLGENMYSVNKGKMSAGLHIIPINGSEFPSGVYFVRFNTDNAITTNKLVIQK